ncbi:MAG TPA: hypothetical protein VME66_01625 [Candidatus Acidoferrales bacterium]|nr:hypothetical protein [Candidatus Acidoferrales bacterium]
MSAFQEHFLDKYFGYRARYVAYIAEHAPHRARLAIGSEVARLTFSLAGSSLCAVIFWVLAVEAAGRSGGWLRVPVLSFLACALTASYFMVLTLRGLSCAIHALQQGSKRSKCG